ncbi:MAG: family 78 glycoside hydrolase catalytic domain, partial [Oliverpabstia sp.]
MMNKEKRVRNMLQIYDLKTEYLHEPVGIDSANPRFSWKIKSDATNVIQKSYRIIAKSGKDVVWDSQTVRSNESQQILYAGETLVSRQKICWSVTVTTVNEQGYEETSVSEEAHFEMGLLKKEDWKAKWIEPEVTVERNARKPSPYLRKVFYVKKGLVSARIYQSAHGLYEFWINGKQGTEDVFKPGLTSYYHRVQYQVYDIMELLQEGQNCWSVVLGDGWWRGVTGGSVMNNYGYKLHFLGQIELTYSDGIREIIKTDETFRTATGGLLASDMLMGDIYDAALEPEGWKLVGFDDSAWQQVHVTEEHTDAALIASRSVPVREKEVFEPKVLTDAKGNRVLDFGQNLAGYVMMRLRECRKGQKIRLVHGEDMKNGCFSLDNINHCSIPVEAFQEVTYYCKGEREELYCPRFSVFGFRYVLLEGYDNDILPGDFFAIAVYSDLEETGTFTCSNPLINRLVANSRWSQKGNFLDVAVDCPTRERNAWTGDAQIYARTSSYFMNVYPFFEKWMQDQAIEQYASGKVGITFPSTSSVHNPEELQYMQKLNPMAALAGPEGDGNIGEDCAGWGDSAAWIPYMMYLCYGDKQILKNQYDTAKKWVDYMLHCAKDHNPMYEDQLQYHHITDGELDADYIYDTRMHYGEWMEPIPKKETGGELMDAFARMIREGKPKVATAYMCRSSENVAHMAKILGKEEDHIHYTQIAERIRKVYSTYLIEEDGTIEPGHQASYVRALAMKLCTGEKKEKVIQQLIHEIESNDYRLNTGFLSTPFLLPVLVDCGYPEIAFRILEQTEYPGWLHPVLLGATTILESWNGMDVHDASYNHYSYGAVCDFLFGYVAGIRPIFEHPGYKEFELCPTIGGSLTCAAASYESLYGRIESRWERKGQKIVYECVVPV